MGRALAGRPTYSVGAVKPSLSRVFWNYFVCFLNLPGRDRFPALDAAIGRCFRKVWRQREARVTLQDREPEKRVVHRQCEFMSERIAGRARLARKTSQEFPHEYFHFKHTVELEFYKTVLDLNRFFKIYFP